MDINIDCFLDMVIDEKIEVYFTGEKVKDWQTGRGQETRFFTPNIQKSVHEGTKQPDFD